MAIAVDIANLGGAFQLSSGSSVAFNTSSAVASGGLIVLGVGLWNGSVTLSSVSGGGLTWTIDKAGRAAAPGNEYVAIVSAPAPSGLASGTTITATLSGATDSRSIGGTSFTGADTGGSRVDGTPLGPVGVDPASTAWSTGNYSIAAGSVIVASVGNESNASLSTITAPSVEAWERVDDTGPFISRLVAYRIEASAGSYAVAGTWGTAAKTNTVAVAYKASAGGGTPAPRLLGSLGVGT